MADNMTTQEEHMADHMIYGEEHMTDNMPDEEDRPERPKGMTDQEYKAALRKDVFIDFIQIDKSSDEIAQIFQILGKLLTCLCAHPSCSPESRYCLPPPVSLRNRSNP